MRFFFLFSILLLRLESFSQMPKFTCGGGGFEIRPQYPGGDKALMKFVKDSIHYPKTLMDKDRCGKIVVRFQVDTLGFVQNPKIIKDEIQDSSLCADIIKTFKSMPQWIPGTQMGKLVSVYYTFPMTFLLDDYYEEKNKADKK